MSIAGGAWTNEHGGLNTETGWCSPPHFGENSPKTGAQVFVFFENGNINKPVYFASAQSGPGWFSEHPNQHVFHSDNIRVRIDEEPTHPDSTCQFDTYNDKNSIVSITDGTKKKVPTRLDIEVLATDINAVNIQIRGNVNMKIIGDWYVHHEGHKHETHIGDTYIKHIGDTFIESSGLVVKDHTGNVSKTIDGFVSKTILDGYHKEVEGNYDKTVTDNHSVKIGNNFEKIIGTNSTWKINGSESREILGDKTVFAAGEASYNIIKSWNNVVGAKYSLQANDNITATTTSGNIELKTLGKYEIMKDGYITGTGYKNLGNRGNIKLTSTFGNIGLFTEENKEWADLETDTTCVAWNPSYLNQMGLLSQFIPGIDTDMIVKPVSVGGDLASIFTFLQQSALFDGLPTFLPTKMIMQNPNIKSVSGAWINDFRNIDDDWTNLNDNNFWKLISKVIGNVTVKSWNGDIDLKTAGTLGNGGNINIIANNQYGALPGYKAGNVNIDAQSPFRIFTDPRDLFLDTHLQGKFMGTFSWFSSTASPTPSIAPPAISVKPFAPVQMILGMLGIPVQFGFAVPSTNGKGGCAACIYDVLVQAAADLGIFSMVPWVLAKLLVEGQPELHHFNALHPALGNTGECPGSVSILKQESNGYAHAVDTYHLDETFSDANSPFGNVIINGTGSYNVNAGKNATIFAKEHDFNFGVSSLIKTDWINPSEGLNPLDIIFGESPVAFPGVMCKPVVKTADLIYYNSFNNKNFGEYISKFNGFTNTGVYKLGIVDLGTVGFEVAEYKLSIPYLDLNLKELTVDGSISVNVDNSVPEYEDKNYNIYATSNTAANSVNPRAMTENQPMENAYYLQVGNPDIFAVTVSGCHNFDKLKDQLPNTANAVSMAATIAGQIFGSPPDVLQKAKNLANMPVPAKNDLYLGASYIGHFYDAINFKAWMPQKMTTDIGLI
mgnify:CR=1 FL=1